MEHHKKMMNGDKLPLSLIESNILPRLRAKTVGRCMCVCKQWKSFLSTPMFARMHLNHVTINDYKLLLPDVNRLGSFRMLDCEPLNDGSTTSRSIPNPDPSVSLIVASLDGLVCLASRNVPGKLVFWNPLTGSYKRLSANPNFAFPFDNTYDAVGFYMDSSNNYKLLYLVYWGRLRAYIYSNILDSWREIDQVSADFTTCRSPATFYGQCLYFKATAKDTSTDITRHSLIICFDVKTEKFRKIRCPPVPVGAKDYCRSLVILNRCMHLCVSYILSNAKQHDMWRMDDDSQWVKVLAFDNAKRNKLTRQYICSASIDNWLAVVEKNEVFNKMDTEEFATHCWDFCLSRWALTSVQTIYVETLVSPNP